MEREDKRVAQLWGGRFTKETDKLVYNFNASISFDQKFYKQDMEGSIAHVKMLGKQGILTEKEMQDIVDCLKEILKEVEEGKLIITDEYEDIHSFVEANLIDRIGDPGKKLHTGRSRNDQVALDMKLSVRDEIEEIDAELKKLLEALIAKQLARASRSEDHFLVAMRLGDTPVLIPNTMVKTQAADGTILETVWESRWLPDLFKKIAEKRLNKCWFYQ